MLDRAWCTSVSAVDVSGDVLLSPQRVGGCRPGHGLEGPSFTHATVVPKSSAHAQEPTRCDPFGAPCIGTRTSISTARAGKEASPLWLWLCVFMCSPIVCVCGGGELWFVRGSLLGPDKRVRVVVRRCLKHSHEEQQWAFASVCVGLRQGESSSRDSLENGRPKNWHHPWPHYKTIYISISVAVLSCGAYKLLVCGASCCRWWRG